MANKLNTFVGAQTLGKAGRQEQSWKNERTSEPPGRLKSSIVTTAALAFERYDMRDYFANALQIQILTTMIFHYLLYQLL